MRSLAAALLRRAIADALKGKDDADTALAWVHGYPSLLSFAWCCSVLEIEQERARGCFLALIQSPQQFRHLVPSSKRLRWRWGLEFLLGAVSLNYVEWSSPMADSGPILSVG